MKIKTRPRKPKRALIHGKPHLKIKRASFAALVFVAVFAMIAIALTVRARSLAYGGNWICSSWGNASCLTLNGNPKADTPLSTTRDNRQNWKFQRYSLGTVTDSYPFTNDSLAAYYYRHRVVQIKLAYDTSLCIGTYNFNGRDYLKLTPCNGGTGITWVESGTWLINSRATNKTAGGADRQLMTGDTAKAYSVWLQSPETNPDLYGRQNWADINPN